MARKTVLVSDMTGETIEEGKAAKVRITFQDARSGSIELDVTALSQGTRANQGAGLTDIEVDTPQESLWNSPSVDACAAHQAWHASDVGEDG